MEIRDRSSTDEVIRFSLGWRLQHILLALGVFGLALTGLAYRWYDTAFGRLLISLDGGFGNRGILHRTFAICLGVAVVWHVSRVLFTRDGHEDFLALMPEKGDGKRWLQAVRAKFSGTETVVEWGRYTFGQKVQYWAVAIGVILMISSGLILLFGNQSIAALPKWIIDLIRVIHGGQGVELMVFIVLWHLYSTHLYPGIFPMDKSWLNGKISKRQLYLFHRREFQRQFGQEKPDAK